MLNDNTFTTDKSIISCKFNDSFVNIGPILVNKIPPQTISHLKFMEQSAVYSIFPPYVTNDEIKIILLSLDEKLDEKFFIVTNNIKSIHIIHTTIWQNINKI